MSEHDQHGNHFPDSGHLHKWPSDAYGDGPRESGGGGLSPDLTRVLVVLFCLLVLAYLISGIASHGLQIRESQEKAAAVHREQEIQRKVKEMREQEKNKPPINYFDFSDDFRKRKQP